MLQFFLGVFDRLLSSYNLSSKYFTVFSLVVAVLLSCLDFGSPLECYLYSCKSSVSTKCRVFPRWSSETVECSGTCYMLRNTSKNFVDVERGCTGWSSPGCRPVVKYDGTNTEDYYHFEKCYCNNTRCNGGQAVTSHPKLLTCLFIFTSIYLVMR